MTVTWNPPFYKDRNGAINDFLQSFYRAVPGLSAAKIKIYELSINGKNIDLSLKAKRTAAGAAPRASHPSDGLPEPYSWPVTPRRLKTAARSDYDDKGVPGLLRVVARKLPRLLHGKGVCRSLITGVTSCGLETRSWRTLRPARRRRDVSVCPILHRDLAGLSLNEVPGSRMERGDIRCPSWVSSGQNSG